MSDRLIEDHIIRSFTKEMRFSRKRIDGPLTFDMEANTLLFISQKKRQRILERK